MSDTIGSLVDKLITADLKMWNNQEIYYEIRHMDFAEFKQRYLSEEKNQEDIFHHSLEQDHEGNFWVPTSVYPYLVDKKFVGSERNVYSDDAITKVSPNGEILFQKSVTNIFIENNLGFLIFPITAFYTTDPIHLNDIQPVLTDSLYWKRGDLFLSLRNQSMIVLYRPSTNKIIWKGTNSIIQQHDVDISQDFDF